MARTFLPAAALVALFISAPAFAQDGELSHTEYLEAVGLLEKAAGMEQWLRDELETRKPEWSTEKRFQNAAFFAFILTVSGVTAGAATSIEERGVDVIHGISGYSRPFIEQALLADVVVVGDVVHSGPSDEPNDGFELSYDVQVRRVLKGQVSGNTIVVRRRERNNPRDIAPVTGNRYLLLLSSGMYQFAASRHRAGQGLPPSATPTGHFSIYRIYQIDEGKILWSNFNRDDTAFAFEQIQTLDELLQAAAR